MESNSSELRSSELGGFPPQAKLGQGSKGAQLLTQKVALLPDEFATVNTQNSSLESETVFDLPANISISVSDDSTFVSSSVSFPTPSATENIPENEESTVIIEKSLSEPVEKQSFTDQVEMNYNSIDMILETEKQNNKLDTWNKLDKTGKIVKLHAFDEKYGKTNNMPAKEIKMMKLFFIECLEKMKLQKAKDVVYNKENGEITSIPSLHFNTTNHKFTLKIMDTKRVSTLKCLTPKRISEKIRESIDTKN